MVGLFGLAKYRSGSPLLRLEPFGALPFLPGLIPERFLENLLDPYLGFQEDAGVFMAGLVLGNSLRLIKLSGISFRNLDGSRSLTWP